MMLLSKEILKTEALSLPVTYTEGACEEAICTKIKAFHDTISEFDNVDLNWLKSLNKFKRLISKMYSEYYLGHVSKAYSFFKKSLHYYSKEMPIAKVSIPDEPLFRARTNTGIEDYLVKVSKLLNI